RLPAPGSRLPAPGSRLPAPGSRLPAPAYSLLKNPRVKYLAFNSPLSSEDKSWVYLSFLKAYQIYSFRNVTDPDRVPDRSLVATLISGVKNLDSGTKIFDPRFINPESSVKVFKSKVKNLDPRFLTFESGVKVFKSGVKNPRLGFLTNKSLVTTYKGKRDDNEQ
ncbi:MAG: hypothetical protein LBJ41_06945, partial [Treponema sp.]|nr:hypothetical protein [Treponema sp.]